jgi:hypothetical protein
MKIRFKEKFNNFGTIKIVRKFAFRPIKIHKGYVFLEFYDSWQRCVVSHGCVYEWKEIARSIHGDNDPCMIY